MRSRRFKKSEVPSTNQLLGNSEGGVTPGDPEKDKNDDQASIKKIGIKDTQTFRDAEQQIAANAERFEKLGLRPISKKDLKHIVNNHTKIGEIAKRRSFGDKGSVFTDENELINLILDAWEFGSEIENGVKRFDCGRIIGETDKRGSTSIIEVVLNKTKDGIRRAKYGY